MVTIKKKMRGNQEYFYLEHTIRKGASVAKRELYLGKKIPKNIEEVRREFLQGIYKEKWHKTIDDIKRAYSKESKRTPFHARLIETEKFMIKFTYDSQKIEGSRLTLRETSDLLQKGITPRGKPIQDVKEAEAHKEVFQEMMKYEKDLSLQTVLHWHKKLFQWTKPDIAGKIRQHQVLISGSRFVPPFPAEVYPLLMEFFKWYDKNKNKLHAVELAALLHLKFVTIHPFGDGNGRISRLMMNFVLNKHNHPMLNIPYERRISYYNALERSQTKQNEGIFLQWFFKKYIRENSRYLKEDVK